MDPRAGAWSLLVIGACSSDWDEYDPRLTSSAASAGSGGAGGMVTVSSGGAGAKGGGASGGSGAVPSWLDDGLTGRRALDVSLSAGIDETLTDFPILVRLEAAQLPDVESELRFGLDDHQTLLAHEIERWDDDGESIVWVKMPSIDATVSRIWMYYGGRPLTTMIDPADVWSNGFVAVWHLGEQLVDSTIGGHDGIAVGSAPVSGLLGSGTTFDGNGDYVDVSAAPVFDELFVTGGTLSVFIQPTSAGEVDRARIIDRTTTTDFADGWSLLMSHYATPDSVGFAHDFVGGYGWWTTPPGSITYGDWHHVAASFSEVDPEPALYIDGVPQRVVVDQTPAGLPPATPDLAVRIGGRSGGEDRDYLGEMDELRIADVVRTPGWVAAEALGAVVTIGEPEMKP